MKITKTESGKYHARVYIGEYDGKKKFISVTAPTKAECQIKCADIMRNRNANPHEITVGEAIERYISENEAYLSATTVKAYRSYARSRFLELQKIKVDKLSTETVQSHIKKELSQYTANGDKINVNYVKNAVALIRASVDSVQRGLVEWGNLRYPQSVKREILCPTEDEMARLYGIIKGTWIELPVILAATMSLRTAEIRGLQWQDYDGRSVYIRRNKVLKDTVKLPKTNGSIRSIVAPQIVRDLFNKMKRGKDTDFIFDFGESSVRNALRRICLENKMPVFGLHAFRHYFATMGLANGTDPKVIQELGGWSSPVVMRSNYQSVLDRQKMEAIDKITQNFKDG